MTMLISSLSLLTISTRLQSRPSYRPLSLLIALFLCPSAALLGHIVFAPFAPLFHHPSSWFLVLAAPPAPLVDAVMLAEPCWFSRMLFFFFFYFFAGSVGVVE